MEITALADSSAFSCIRIIDFRNAACPLLLWGNVGGNGTKLIDLSRCDKFFELEACPTALIKGKAFIGTRLRDSVDIFRIFARVAVSRGDGEENATTARKAAS